MALFLAGRILRLSASKSLFENMSSVSRAGRSFSNLQPKVDSPKASKDVSLWKKLYEKDYLRRKKLSQFLDGLAQIIAEREVHSTKSTKSKDSMRPSDKPPGFTLQAADSDTIQLKSELTHEWIAEMMKRAHSNDTLLDANALRKIIELAKPILQESPNITLVPKVISEFYPAACAKIHQCY
jgi:hypothetical protein